MNASLSSCGNSEIRILTEPLIFFFLQPNRGFHASTIPRFHSLCAKKFEPLRSRAFKASSSFPVLSLGFTHSSHSRCLDIPEHTLDEILNSIPEYLSYAPCLPARLLVWNTLPFMYLLPLIFEKPTHLFKETFLPPSPGLGRSFVSSLGAQVPTHTGVLRCVSVE